jgi:predicted  nucleic acid-binding Zn-ribbon protein
MNFTQQVLTDIKELQNLEGRPPLSGEEPVYSKAAVAEIDSLRKRIPTSILGHYDRLRLRGKQGVAAVRNGVCGACHLQLPRSVVLHMQGSHEMGVCDHCGAFIFPAEPEVINWQEPVAAAKKRPAKRQKATAAAAV